MFEARQNFGLVALTMTREVAWLACTPSRLFILPKIIASAPYQISLQW